MASLPLPPLRRLSLLQSPATAAPDLSTPVIPPFVPPPLGGDPSAPAPLPAPVMPQTLPQLPPLPPPDVSAAPVTPPAAAGGRTITPLDIGPVGPIAPLEDQYTRLVTSAPGVAQIKNPLLRGLANFGDILGSVTLPGLMAVLPGTRLHHEMLVRGAAEDVNQAREDELKAAQAAHFSNLANAARAEASPANTVLRAYGLGLIPDPTSPTGYRPAKEEELGIPARTLAEFRQARIDPDSFENQLKQDLFNLKQQGQESTEEYRQKNQQLAQLRLTGSAEDRQQKAQRFAIENYKWETPQPTPTTRTAAERAQMSENIRHRIEEQLKDPEIQAAIGPLAGRASEAQAKLGTASPKVAAFYNDMTSYAAFMAGLHPVKGLGGLEYFEQRIGGLGQTPEQLLGKLAASGKTARDVIAEGAAHPIPQELTAPPGGVATGAVRPELTQWDAMIDAGLSDYPQVTKPMVYALMQGENASGDPKKQSSTGATGLMQLTQDTASAHGVTDRTDPQQNLRGGIGRFDEALTRQGGDAGLAAADYYSGPGAIRDGQIVDTKEHTAADTRRYAEGFLRRYNRLSGAGQAPAVAAATVPSPPGPGPAAAGAAVDDSPGTFELNGQRTQESDPATIRHFLANGARRVK